MSILIKGMEMPTDGNGIFIDWHGNVSMIGNEIKDVPNAHAVELPPHGRLIDADALRLLYDFNGYKPTGDMTEEEFDRLMCRLPAIRANIDDAPTIIESEGEE